MTKYPKHPAPLSTDLYENGSNENSRIHRQLSMEDVCSIEERPPPGLMNQDIIDEAPNMEMYILDGNSDKSWNNISGLQIPMPSSCEHKNTVEKLKDEN